jgi:uncharacterized membrane protein
VDLEPLLNAPALVQAHVATVVPAFFIGAWLLFFSRKGARFHRVFGVLFLSLMVATAIITIFIHRRAPDSPFFGLSLIHLFVPLVFIATWRALDGALRGNVKQHRAWVLGLFLGALVINGVNNVFFLPGITREVFFGP